MLERDVLYPPQCVGRCRVGETGNPETLEVLRSLGGVLGRNCKGPIGSPEDIHPGREVNVVTCQNPVLGRAAGKAIDFAYFLECTVNENPSAAE